MRSLISLLVFLSTIGATNVAVAGWNEALYDQVQTEIASGIIAGS